ncbi:hypothetical protein B0T26DRAFT_682622 [Lasiosphaeria miniovina]|uniref:AB hydrolase-1 domain-containing protein n=1 Tax=Lasiosphaeria miniovina TaxID=1954250 RepID=A0AA40BEZ0_9PEZI|nr:uncharacterized protein B0T26DRAFT_682622 [Lasiosphaeria miniovina]KAK0733022.1 hypothetical protein B0T26DRAFT_682622 [Lasiosphaeria miniovina]
MALFRNRKSRSIKASIEPSVSVEDGNEGHKPRSIKQLRLTRDKTTKSLGDERHSKGFAVLYIQRQRSLYPHSIPSSRKGTPVNKAPPSHNMQPPRAGTPANMAPPSGIYMAPPSGTYMAPLPQTGTPTNMAPSYAPPPAPNQAWTGIQPAVLHKMPVPNNDTDGDTDKFSVMTLKFEVPLNHQAPAKGETLVLHAELVYGSKGSERGAAPVVKHEWKRILGAKPFLLFLCGGPGDGNSHRRIPLLNHFALRRGYQVLYVDYRGTGRSYPISPSYIAVNNPNKAAADAEAQRKANYLALFRQDNIVRDLEAIRLCLTNIIAQSSVAAPPPSTSASGSKTAALAAKSSKTKHASKTAKPSKPVTQPAPAPAAPVAPPQPVKWTLVGQSFGGWIALTYLSFLPESLAGVYLSAGLAPVGAGAPDFVYAALAQRIAQRNEAYYARYPDDVWHVKQIVAHLDAASSSSSTTSNGGYAVKLPGDARLRLTAQAFMTLGRAFGAASAVIAPGPPTSKTTPDAYDALHQLVERASFDIANYNVLSDGALVLAAALFAGGFRLHERPLYGVLHEAIYCDGPGYSSSWSAQRILLTHFPAGQFVWTDPSFSATKPSPAITAAVMNDGTAKLYFSGEMVLPAMVPAPLRSTANALARKADWPALYDSSALAANRCGVTVRAVAYADDMYVDLELARRAAAGIRGAQVLEAWNGWKHGAIKEADKTVAVLEALFDGKPLPV